MPDKSKAGKLRSTVLKLFLLIRFFSLYFEEYLYTPHQYMALFCACAPTPPAFFSNNLIPSCECKTPFIPHHQCSGSMQICVHHYLGYLPLLIKMSLLLYEIADRWRDENKKLIQESREGEVRKTGKLANSLVY